MVVVGSHAFPDRGWRDPEETNINVEVPLILPLRSKKEDLRDRRLRLGLGRPEAAERPQRELLGHRRRQVPHLQAREAVRPEPRAGGAEQTSCHYNFS